MRALELVSAPALDAAGHMGLDEALMEAGVAETPVLRFYRWAKTGVTYGYGQRWQTASQLARERGMGAADLVRRATGGGVVFHDGDVTFSLVFSWERLSDPSVVYKNIHRGIHMGLKDAGVLSRIWTGKARHSEGSVMEKACFAGEPEMMDLVRPDGMKLLGGALRRRAGIGLYQGSLRPDLIVASLPAIQSAIAEGVVKEFGSVSLDIPAAALAEGERQAVKYRSDRWNKRR